MGPIKRCKYHGETVSDFFGIIKCKKDGKVHRFSDECETSCPYYKPTIVWRLKEWLERW